MKSPLTNCSRSTPFAGVRGSVHPRCGLISYVPFERSDHAAHRAERFVVVELGEHDAVPVDEVGEDLTRERFVEALEGLTEFPSNSVGPGSYGPDKHYAATEVNILEWARDCSCWVATDGTTFPVVEE